MLTVHLRITESGRPVPCRVRLVADGAERMPLGRPPDDAETVVRLADGHHAAIDGSCEVPLPPGPVRVLAHRGPLYEPLDVVHPLAAGKMAMRFALTRRADWRPRGWHAGDCRVHRLTPHGAALQGAAEDLAFVQLLVRGGESLAAFSGDRPCLSGETTVAVNTLNADPVLGSVALLNAHRPVFPLSAHDPPWSVFDWCDQCHRKKGLVVWPDLPRLTEENPQGEALAALVAKKIDAVEVCSAGSLTLYHRLLNCGLRPALVGSSGRDDAATTLGAVRTYAQFGGSGLGGRGRVFETPESDADPGTPGSAKAPTPATQPSLADWIEAIRAGRTFASSGPLLEFTVSPGRLRAEALFADRVEILANGEPIAAGPSPVEVEFAPSETSWVAARCDGFAHSSAVWIDVPGRPFRPRPHPSLLAALAETGRRVARPDVREHLDDARRYLQGGAA